LEERIEVRGIPEVNATFMLSVGLRIIGSSGEVKPDAMPKAATPPAAQL
jgi:hypothetical protein